jgi:hypothetical protein
MTLLPHQQRVVTEKEELDVKLEALRKFFQTDTFLNLEKSDQDLLWVQEKFMDGYSATLNQRIKRF